MHMPFRYAATEPLDDLSEVRMAVGSARDNRRQLLFSDGEHIFDVRIGPVGDAWQITGHVLGPLEPGKVTLRGSGGTYCTDLDDCGTFVVPVMPPGTYVLLVRLPDVEVELPHLTIWG